MATYDDVCTFLRREARSHLTPMVQRVDAGEVQLFDEPQGFLRVMLAKNTIARCPGVRSVQLVNAPPDVMANGSQFVTAVA